MRISRNEGRRKNHLDGNGIHEVGGSIHPGSTTKEA